MTGTDHSPLAVAPWPATTGVQVRSVKTIQTAPGGLPYLIVKVETTEPELVGYGCASDPQRTRATDAVICDYLAPMLVGRDVGDISDIAELLRNSGYWRGGSIANNALAGIDVALWDIKGKLAGAPLYSLFGGRMRTGAVVYGQAGGSDIAELMDAIEGYIERGFLYVRAQLEVPGTDTYAFAAPPSRNKPWDPEAYLRLVPAALAEIRSRVNATVGLLHDVHERLSPVDAREFARRVEPVGLKFLEDPLSPEDAGNFALLRQSTSTPLAMGELFDDVTRFVPLVEKRLIDFARVRIPPVGGLTPARRLAAFCEFFGVNLAPHGPPDVSPLGHAANVHLDVSVPNFGVQECQDFGEQVREVFPGTLQVDQGYLIPSSAPGLGVGFDEQAAKKYPVPPPLQHDRWALLRRKDGTVQRP